MPVLSPATPKLAALADVLITGPAPADKLTYIASAKKWENRPLTTNAVTYGPNPAVSYTTTSQTFEVIDPVNLLLTFTADANGQAVIVLTGTVHANNNQPAVIWAVGPLSGPDLTTETVVWSPAFTFEKRFTVVMPLISGLVPGAAYAYTWYHRIVNHNFDQIYLDVSDGNAGRVGPAQMGVSPPLALIAGAATASAPGDAEADGTAQSASHSDHRHAREASPNPMTTLADLIVGGAVTAGVAAPARLGKGTDGQVLTVDPATHLLKWATPATGFGDPTTTKGDLIVHGATTTRLPVGADANVLTADSTAAAGVKWAAAGGGASPLLATVAYDPGGQTNYTTPSHNTFAAVDAANLTIPFTVPASGAVLFEFSGVVSCDNGDAMYWGVGVHGGAAVAGSDTYATGQGGNGGNNVRVSASKRITGLNPGAALQWDWLYRSAGGAANGYLFVGGSLGPGLMRVWAA